MNPPSSAAHTGRSGAVTAGPVTDTEWAYLVPTHIHSTPSTTVCANGLTLTSYGAGGWDVTAA